MLDPSPVVALLACPNRNKRGTSRIGPEDLVWETSVEVNIIRDTREPVTSILLRTLFDRLMSEVQNSPVSHPS